MKLAGKLAIAVVLVMSLVFGLRGYQAARRELSRAKLDLREDHFIIGRALRPAIKEVWRLEGRERALAVLGFADDRIQRARKVRIRWATATGDGQSLEAVALPAAGGLNVLRELRAQRRRPPFILMGAAVDAHIQEHARTLGALAVFTKPFDVDDLRAAVKAAASVLPRWYGG